MFNKILDVCKLYIFLQTLLFDLVYLPQQYLSSLSKDDKIQQTTEISLTNHSIFDFVRTVGPTTMWKPILVKLVFFVLGVVVGGGVVFGIVKLTGKSSSDGNGASNTPGTRANSTLKYLIAVSIAGLSNSMITFPNAFTTGRIMAITFYLIYTVAHTKLKTSVQLFVRN